VRSCDCVRDASSPATVAHAAQRRESSGLGTGYVQSPVPQVKRVKGEHIGGVRLAMLSIEKTTQQKDWKDHTECLVRLLTILTDSAMCHDSQEWTIATEAKARETGTAVATASATTANSHGAETEMGASVDTTASGAATVQSSTVGCMSATKVDTEASMTGTLVAAARSAETKAGGRGVMNGSNANGRAGAMVRDAAAVAGVIDQMAVGTAVATEKAT
jgi:hypothetical protein